MMEPEQACRNIDCYQASEIASVLPKMPLVASHDKSWEGLQLAHYRQPAFQTDAINFAQHVISINIGQPVIKERRLQGKRQSDCFATGDISITPAHMPRQVELMGEAEFIHLYLKPNFLENFAHDSLQSAIEIQPQFKVQDNLILQVSLTLKHELESNANYSRFYAESAATFLAAHLIQNYSVKTSFPWRATSNLPKPTLRRVMDYIEQNLDQDLSLNALARVVQMSSFSLARSFKRATGKTLHQYIIQLRIEKSKQLLKKTKLSITEVSLSVGFQSHSHFSNVFRRITGMTPRQFRQQFLA